MLEWNVFTDDYNSKKIEIYNVFEHNRFFEDCKKMQRKIFTTIMHFVSNLNVMQCTITGLNANGKL